MGVKMLAFPVFFIINRAFSREEDWTHDLDRPGWRAVCLYYHLHRLSLRHLTVSCSTHTFHPVPSILADEQMQGCDSGERQWYLLVVSAAKPLSGASKYQRVKTEIGRGV